jgi:hypothetical protein
MANYNVTWIKSTKGGNQLVVDGYVFHCNGKGKVAGVKYWICSSPNCKVNAKTNGNQLVSLHGVINPPDHGHVNKSALLASVNLQVCTVSCCNTNAFLVLLFWPSDYLILVTCL